MVNVLFTFSINPRIALYCQSAKISPAPNSKNTGTGTRSSYGHALVTCTYETRRVTYETPSGVKISESFEPSMEYRQANHQLLQWGTGTVPEDEDDEKEITLIESEAPGIPNRIMDYQITYYEQANVPAGILDVFDRVNSNIVYPQTEGLSQLIFRPETLLYNPPSLTHKITEGNKSLWDISYRFGYRPNFYNGTYYGWNYFWRTKTQAYETIYVKNGVRFYTFPQTDFSGLLPRG
ncbi:MAG: hypothetical protein WC464_05740 [Bdellovibrionales bacterium]